ncbi:type I restriction endonuclease subunit R [Aeoliella sp. SH292]|uniref:type I restriction endonuclease subunit R n=1 Tax=Aeoliella sp. SH292 TaxID=3454464 RepID=UPI003F95D0F2
MTPEQEARAMIDAKLASSGWIVQTYKEMNLGAGRGLAVTEFPGAHGPADYLLYVDCKALGVVEAKPVGHTLTGVEGQSASYAEGLSDKLPAWRRPLPFQYETTGEVTQFTNWMDPHARSRSVFQFHGPETLLDLVKDEGTLRGRLRQMPELLPQGLWPKQFTAINNLEESLALAKPKALIQMATGSGKTFTAANIAYRLIKHAGARRICFLVDRTNLGLQTLKEFQQFQPLGERHTFDKLYVTSYPRTNHFDPVNKVVITTIQRLYSVLTGAPELAEEDEERSSFEGAGAFKKPPKPIVYNEKLPPEFFDAIIVDECHRSIYSVWGDVLKYFDAFTIGLTATPSKQTIGFFDKNLVMEYSHAEAVADRVNVPYDVYEINTRITSDGSDVEAGYYVGKRSRRTRAERMEQLDDDLNYDASQLDRAVVAVDQIRTVVQTFRDRLYTEIFPGRKEVPKTLIFAKDDSHADDILRIVREEFGRGNEFCQKITYRTGTMRCTRKVKDPDGTEREEVYYEKIKGKTGEDVLIAFRNSFNPRIAVTVDMIATGTDLKPVEIVFFMRSVRSSNYFEQMKGRGVRVIDRDELKGVTPEEKGEKVVKTRFVLIDAVGVCKECKSERGPLDREPNKTLKQVFDYIKAGGLDPDAASALAGKLTRLSREMSEEQHEEVRRHAAGRSIDELVAGLVAATDDAHIETRAQLDNPAAAELTVDHLKEAEEELIRDAIRPFYDPRLRDLLLTLKAQNEQTIDHISQDELLSAGYSQAARDQAHTKIENFRKFIEEHKDELLALQVFYGQATPDRLRFRDLKELAKLIERPPVSATTEELWRCYEALEASQATGKGGQMVTDLISIIRHTLTPDEPLTPFAEVVRWRYAAWRKQQTEAGVTFTDEQSQWLDKIAEHIATSLAIEMDDFHDGWFAQRGNLGKAHELFGDRLSTILDDLNRNLCA